MNKYLEKIASELLGTQPLGTHDVNSTLASQPKNQLKMKDVGVNGTIRLQKDKPDSIARKF